MKSIIFIVFILQMLASLGDAYARSQEEQQLAMAEAAFVTTLMADTFPKSKYRCTQNDYACLGAHQSELGLALISARNTRLSREKFARLLRFQLDGALSEDYTCQVLSKGKTIVADLKGLNAEQLERDCLKDVEATIRKTGKKFEGFDAKQICAVAGEIQAKRAELLDMLKQNKTCN